MSRRLKQPNQKVLSMVEPPSYDESEENSGNRIHQRRSIMNELDMIKDRVHQILQDYEASQADHEAFSEASVSMSLRTLENLLRRHQFLGASKERELSTARDFFNKCSYIARCLEEAAIDIVEERTNDELIWRSEEFKSALRDTMQMLKQIKSLNAQMIKKLFDIIESQNEKLQRHGLVALANNQDLNYDKLISMYTSEAIKCYKLEGTVAAINEELNLVKSQNLYLMEQTQSDKLKLQETEGFQKDLEEVIKRLRLEIATLKHQRPATQQENNVHFNDQILSDTNVSSDQEKPQTKLLPKALPSNATNEWNKNVPPKGGVQTKKQVATKFSSKLLDQQLNYMEDLMVQGQQNIITFEKQLSNLVYTTDDALQQKYQEEYTCLHDTVEAVINILGSQGTNGLPDITHQKPKGHRSDG